MEEILKQFKIIFNLDNKPLEKGIAQSENSLKNLGKTLGALVSTYFTYSIFKDLTFGFANFNTQLGNSLQLIGANVTNVSALGNSLKRFGGDTNDAINSLENINKAMQDAKFGGGALIETAKKYGVWISPYAKAEDALLSLGKQLSKYDVQTRVTIGRQLGLSDSIIRAFADGGERLEKLIKKQKELGVTTENDVKISNEFSDSILDLKDTFSALSRDISRILLPIVTKIVNLFISFIEFIKKHKQLVMAFFAGLAIALSPFLAILTKIAIANVKAFAPFYLAIAIITAISLIIEDLFYYFKGWNSVTGDLVKKFPGLYYIIEPLRPLILGIYDIFEKILDFFKDPSWDNFSNILKSIGAVIVNFIKLPFEGIRSIIDSLINKLPFLETAIKPFKIIIDNILNVLNFILDLINNFSIDKVINEFITLKDSLSDIGLNLLDKINPLNWFKKENEEAISKPAPFISTIPNNNYSNTYNVNNNFNQNITGGNALKIADQTSQSIIGSIAKARQNMGAQ